MKKAAISSNTHPMPCLFYLIIIWGLAAVARNQTCKEGIYSAEGKSQNRSGLLLSEGGMPRGPSEPQTFSWKCARLLLGSEARVAVTGTLRYWKSRRVLSCHSPQRWARFCWNSHTNAPPTSCSHHIHTQAHCERQNGPCTGAPQRDPLCSSSLGGHLPYFNSNYLKRVWIPELLYLVIIQTLWKRSSENWQRGGPLGKADVRIGVDTWQT